MTKGLLCMTKGTDLFDLVSGSISTWFALILLGWALSIISFKSSTVTIVFFLSKVYCFLERLAVKTFFYFMCLLLSLSFFDTSEGKLNWAAAEFNKASPTIMKIVLMESNIHIKIIFSYCAICIGFANHNKSETWNCHCKHSIKLKAQTCGVVALRATRVQIPTWGPFLVQFPFPWFPFCPATVLYKIKAKRSKM